MLTFKRQLTFLVFLYSTFVAGTLQAQTYTMSNGGNISACSGTFMDPGGTGNYTGGASTWTYTICSGTPGDPVYLTFPSMNLFVSTGILGCTDQDQLRIFDGNTATGTQIPGSPFTGTATPGNVYGLSGCITIQFVRTAGGSGGLFGCSANSGASGWEATISCTEPPPLPATGGSCFDALPFCTANTYNFPNATSGTAPSGPSYGCLSQQPRPIWYYMEIDQAGTLQIDLSQTTGQNNSGTELDVDFALWGPFSDLASGCSAIMAGGLLPTQCSYDPSNTETIGIGLQGGEDSGQSTPPPAQVGEIYIVLLTNFEGPAGYIDFNQTGGTGSADCTILEPETCTVNASNNGPFCTTSSTINLSASNVAGATYSWTGPNGYTSSSQNPSNISLPSTPGSYTFTVVATLGTGTCNASTTVVIGSGPTVTVPANMNVCNNASVPATTFTSTSTGTTYSWTNSNPSIGLAASGTGNLPAFTATNATTSAASATITVTPSANGCVGTPSSFTINIAPTPTMNTVTNIVACHGTSVPETAFGSTLPGITYAWTNTNPATGIAASGTGNIPAFNASNAGTTPVNGQITVTPSLATCAGTPLTLNVTINPLPTVEAGSPQTVCAGTQVTLSGTGAATYTWDNGVTNNTPFAAANTLTYTVTGTDANGCSNTDNVTISVFPYPVINAGQDQQICIGQSVTLTGTGSTNWNNGVSDGIPFSPTATQTYTLTATDANNCQTTDQVIVTVNPLPVINAGTDQNICFGTAVTLSGTGGASYVWTNNVSNGQPFQPAIGTNSYTVTGTDANGCVNTDNVTINVLPVPVAGLMADQNQGYPVLAVNFTNTSQNATSYEWNFGDGFVISINQPTPANYSFPNIGNYDTYLVASNGICSDTAHMLIIVMPFPDPEIIVPNVFTPNGDNANDLWWIDVRFAASIEVDIYNRWGNITLKMSSFTDRWDGKVNGNEASDGVYFYKYTVTDLNGKITQGHGHVTIER